MAPKISQGLYVPNFDRVLSAKAPMRGSVTTSNIRAISINAAVSATVSPNTLVKNNGKAMDMIFQVIPPAAASPSAYPIFSFKLAILVIIVLC